MGIGGRVRIGQQLATSLFFIAFGAAGWLLGRDMVIGTAGDMGVGYVPRLLSIGCIGVGVIQLLGLLWLRPVPLPVGFAWRPALLVPALVLAFGVLLPWLGLSVTIVVLVVVAAVTSGETFDWRVLIGTALGLALVSTLLFHTLLKLQVPVWPAFISAGLKGLLW